MSTRSGWVSVHNQGAHYFPAGVRISACGAIVCGVNDAREDKVKDGCVACSKTLSVKSKPEPKSEQPVSVVEVDDEPDA